MSLPPRIRAIVREVCAEQGVAPEDLTGPSRRVVLAEARRRCWARIRELDGPEGKPFSYPSIGRMFRRHHTTVLHGVRRLEERAP